MKRCTFNRRTRPAARAGLGMAVLASLLTVPSPARASSFTSKVTDKIKSTFQNLTHLGSSSTTTTPAAPQARGPSGSQMANLNKFLAGGPEAWSVQAPYRIPAGLSVTNRDGTLKDTPLSR